jgi:hypothetical protein
MRHIRMVFTLICAAALSAGLADRALADVAPGDGKTRKVFDILRNGTPIGTNTIEIDRQDDTTTVKIATNIAVTVMFIEAYRYEHTCTEIWKAGQLVSFSSRTNDNGTKHAIEVTPKQDKLSIEVNGKRSEVPKTVAPASLWTKAVINQPELFEPANGKRLQVKVKDLGEEAVSVNGVTRKARHYKLTDKSGKNFERDLWFEGDTLVRMKLVGSDQSTILSELRPSP